MDEFERLLTETKPALRAFAVSLSGRHDKADDLVQDTMFKALRSRGSFEIGTNIKAWLFTILRNEFYSQMRKRGREVQDTDGAFTERLSVHASQHGHMELLDVRAALAKLPADQREAIILIGALGHSYEKAAEMAKCAIGTMKSRVSRARIRLQHLLGDYGRQVPHGMIETGERRKEYRDMVRLLKPKKEPAQPFVLQTMRRRFLLPPPVSAVPRLIPARKPALPLAAAHASRRMVLGGIEFRLESRIRMPDGKEAEIFVPA